MTASLSSLRTRLKTLQVEVAKRKAKSARFDPNEKFTNLPKVDEWWKFAPKIRGGMVLKKYYKKGVLDSPPP